MKLTISSFIFLVTLGCANRTKFNESELRWIKPYQIGDTLIFESDKHEFDTTVIINKETFKNNEDREHIREYSVIWYTNKNLLYNPDGDRLVTLIKTPSSTTSLTFSFLYSNYIFNNLNTSKLDSARINGVYQINTFHPDAKPSKPMILFWHEKQGLIKYVTHDSTVWTKIN